MIPLPTVKVGEGQASQASVWDRTDSGDFATGIEARPSPVRPGRASHQQGSQRSFLRVPPLALCWYSSAPSWEFHPLPHARTLDHRQSMLPILE